MSKTKCEICDIEITKKYLAKHQMTKKHINNATGTAPVKEYEDDSEVKAKRREAFKQHYTSTKNAMGDEKHKAAVALKKWRQRHPDKSVADYKPRAKKGVKPVVDTETINEIVHNEIQNLQQNETADTPTIRRIVKEKVVQQKIAEDVFSNRETLINNIVKISKRKEKTISTNVDRVKNIYKRIVGKDWDYQSFQWLRDTENVFEKVRESWKKSTEKTISNQFVSIAGILKYIDTYETERIFYSKLGSGIVDKLDNTAKDNELNARQKKKAMKWDSIKNIDLTDSNGGNSFLRALHGMYTDMAPRRADDYKLMKIIRKDKVNAGKIAKFDKKFNYIFVDKNKKPVSMTIWEYKEGAKRAWAKKNGNYGQYDTGIPVSLGVKLQKYIVEEKLNSGDFLFGLETNHQKPYSSSGYSSLISKNLFQTFAGIPVDINMVRHAYASWYLPEMKTMRQQEQLAFQMGSSVMELHKTYFKIELTK